MSKIKLHTPMHTMDYETTTEYEVNDIVHVKSVVGDDDAQGTEFYLEGLFKKQFCLESANTLKKLIQENKTEDKPFSIIQSGSGNALAIGSSNQATTGKEGGWSIGGVIATLVVGAIGIILTVILAK